jgi:16S rRNA (cytidine1402-2'-O)-methyltransferase
MLYLVPTPIGNLKDITFRAIEVLKMVDVIFCEDTRTSSKLLNHYEIKKPLSPYHMHNEHKIVQHIVEQISAGKTFALITDAGTPGISDPAFLLVRACIKNNVKVQCLPGATAFVPALVNSGIATNSFVFEGFIPLKKGRQTLLKQLATQTRTIIIYESPYRVGKTLTDFATYFGGNREACVSREISKMFEENKRGTLQELATFYTANQPKGEVVIVVAGYNEKLLETAEN